MLSYKMCSASDYSELPRLAATSSNLTSCCCWEIGYNGNFSRNLQT